MSLQTRLSGLITAIGADIKAINSKIPEVNISVGGPSPRTNELLWVDTDEAQVSAGLIPVGGAAGYFLKKATSADYDAQWAAAVANSPVKFSSGAVQGSTINIGTTWTSLPGLAVTFTPAFNMLAQVDISARFGTNSPTLTSIYLALNVSGGVPTNRVKANAAIGAGRGATEAMVLGIDYLASGGTTAKPACNIEGKDYMQLAAGTSYTFQAAAWTGTASTITWGSSTVSSYITVMGWPI